MPWIHLLTSAAAAAAAVLIGLAAAWLFLRIVRDLGAAGRSAADKAARPVAALTVLLALIGWRQSLYEPAGLALATGHAVTLAMIGVLTWLLLAALYVVEEAIVRRYDMARADNLLARKVQTRLAVLRRLATVLVLVIAASAMLMTFPEVRILGGSLLASAGLAGLVAGLAAQPVMTNLLAGMQIALTQPIRIDDVVVVNGYWGRIEEIDSTYVVLRVWDLRRLILPLSYFLAQPFENWTYHGSDLLGYVYVYADYGVDVGAVRDALSAILRQCPEWDGGVWNLQMTGADEATVQLRALFSTRNSDDRWNLMVHVQEGLVDHLRREQPDHLPRYRVGRVEPPRPGVRPLSEGPSA